MFATNLHHEAAKLWVVALVFHCALTYTRREIFQPHSGNDLTCATRFRRENRNLNINMETIVQQSMLFEDSVFPYARAIPRGLYFQACLCQARPDTRHA